jgi:cytochrome bd-type quinol oxidase subunit 1
MVIGMTIAYVASFIGLISAYYYYRRRQGGIK